MRKLLKDPGFWLSIICLAFILLIIMSLSGCNDPNNRPWRSDPTSIQKEHWMNRYIWMDPKEAQQMRDYKATQKLL